MSPRPTNRSDEQRERDAETDGSIAPRLGALLGEVISHTDQLLSQDLEGDSAEPEALREVARKFMGHELSVDPVMCALVDAVISDLFSRINRNDLRRQLVRHVAETLHDDPDAYKRVCSLWNQLQRSVQ